MSDTNPGFSADPTMRKSHAGQLRDAVAYWPRTWKLIWAAAPRQTVVWAAMLVLQGLLPVALVYLTKSLVDNLVAAMDAGGTWSTVQPVLIALTLIAAIMATMEGLQSIVEWVRTAQSERIQDHIKGLIHQQSTTLDLAFYESPDYHDRLDRARTDAANRPLQLLESAGSVLQNTISLLAMAAVLIPYGLWLPAVLLVSTLPALFVVLRYDRRYHRWWQQTTTDRRRVQYFDTVLTVAAVAPEVRLFGLGDRYQAQYQTLRCRLRSERLRLLRQQSLARLGAGTLTLLVSGAAIAWMVWRAMQGHLTLGDLALFQQAFTRGQGVTRVLLGSVGQIYSNTLFLGNLFSFLDLKREIVAPTTPVAVPTALQQGIRFDSVNFHYPGSDRFALQGFDLHIPAGKVVAIVGANGAGKSTLLKLLCRFYDPQAGRILLDGMDLRGMEPDDVRRRISVLFQFPIGYLATARDNVAFGDLSRTPSQEEIENAARSAGAHELIANLPSGYDTQLGKELAGGVELSGGEWQRIAMARAYIRKAPIVILDEPTSFMDSWAEAAWFERFRDLVRGRTAVLITHRFTIAMRADTIHVMEQGRVIESGSHQELLAQSGRYAASWWEQLRASNPAAAMAGEPDTLVPAAPLLPFSSVPAIQRTPFVIAQEMPTNRCPGRILVLLGDQVVEAGTHEELMARDGVYRELVIWGASWVDDTPTAPQRLDTAHVALAGG